MINKLVVEATIPTVQYGNIKPTIELEGENFETIRDEALLAIKQISDMTAGEGYTFDVRGLPVSSGRTQLAVKDKEVEVRSTLLGKTKLVKVNNGHKYLDGYLSGSKFPEKFYTPFDSEMILNAIVKKFGVTTAEVSAMWKLNNEASTGYGTAIHAALENFDRNKALGDKIKSVKEFKTKPNEIGPNKALSKNPFLKAVVEWFQETVKGEKGDILTEEFIWDDEFKFNGSVDRIRIVDANKKILRIQDYKTDGDIHDKKSQTANSPFKTKIGGELLDYHWLQLSFYAFILQRAGWTVEGLDIFWLNPNKLIKGENPWEVYSSEVIDISEGL